MDPRSLGLDPPSNASAIAAKVINTVRKTRIAIVAFFFHLDDGTGEELGSVATTPCQSQEAAMAVDFLYSLIRQVIDQLPHRLEIPGKIWVTRFESLDGSLETFDLALTILEQLLDQAPATLIIVVDGLEQVDHSEAEPWVTKVLLLLQQATIDTRGKKKIKILYTTAGPSDVLGDMDPDFVQCVEAEEGRPKHMRGRVQSIEDVDLNSESDEDPDSSESDMDPDSETDKYSSV